MSNTFDDLPLHQLPFNSKDMMKSRLEEIFGKGLPPQRKACIDNRKENYVPFFLECVRMEKGICVLIFFSGVLTWKDCFCTVQIWQLFAVIDVSLLMVAIYMRKRFLI